MGFNVSGRGFFLFFFFEEWEGRVKVGTGVWREGLNLYMIYYEEDVFLRKDKAEKLTDIQ